MSEERIWTAGLLVIGDEILSGRTQDRNVGQIATWLNLQGIRLAEVRVVPDDMERIGAAVNALRDAYDYLFTTGGIGPTHDDITRRCHRRGARRARGRPPRRPGGVGGALCDARRPHRGAAAHGARARERGADRESDVGRARHPHRQHLHPRRRAAYCRAHAGGPVRAARRRQAGPFGDDRLLGAGERSGRHIARNRAGASGLPDRILSLLPRGQGRRQFRRAQHRSGVARRLPRRSRCPARGRGAQPRRDGRGAACRAAAPPRPGSSVPSRHGAPRARACRPPRRSGRAAAARRRARR